MSCSIIELKKQILSGQTSLRQLSKQTGIDKDLLKDKIIKVCSDEELKQIMIILKDNKANSSTIYLEGNVKEAVIRILKGEISVRQASKDYNIDRETLMRKTEELANASPEYVKYYIQYKAKRGDYSGINFRSLIIEMIENGMSQTAIAKEYDIPVRTMSRELQKLEKSDDKRDIKLFDIAKIYAEKMIRHEELSDYEQRLYGSIIEELKQDTKFTTINIESNEEKRNKQLQDFKSKVQELREKGMTNGQIAKKLGVGVSTIRRRMLEVTSKEKLQNMQNVTRTEK